MKYTNKELVYALYSRYRKLAFSLNDVKGLLISKYKLNSLKYPHISRGYMKGVFDSLSYDGWGHYDVEHLKFYLDKESLKVADMIMEFEEAKK